MKMEGEIVRTSEERHLASADESRLNTLALPVAHHNRWDADNDDDMAARLKEASQMQTCGKVQINKDLVTEDTEEPFSESLIEDLAMPRKVVRHNRDMNCPGCGVRFQSLRPDDVGYLLPSKVEEVEARIARWRREEGEQAWSVEDEVEALIKGENPYKEGDTLAADNAGGRLEQPLENLKPIICGRCHSLTTTGSTALTSTAPGTPIPPSVFSSLIRKTLTPAVLSSSVILIMVDLFDFTCDGPVKEINDIIRGEEAQLRRRIFDVSTWRHR